MGDSSHTAPAEAPILATKLFPPRLRDRMVRRRRLVSLLDQGSDLVLVSAPAGFGKSTLLAEWLRRRDLAFAWLSLEAADAEPRRFLRYMSAALAPLAPGLEAAVAPYLRGPQLAPAEVVLLPLLNELSRLESPAVLVLDDYHTVEEAAVHGLMEYWVDHQPPNLRLVLSTRVDPPFSLSRWRGQGRLTEIRALDLRFSEDESRSFLSAFLGFDLPAPLARALQRHTEGWIVGLQMAALSMRGQKELGSFVEAFTGSHRFVLDYLTEEVLARQPREVLDFLLRVSLLERFNPPLCDAVLERSGSRDLLERLEAENLFLIPLDAEREWFRFHHLFRQLLERQLCQRLPEDEVLGLRRRACDWLSAEGFPDEALAHALAAGDRQRALGVLERHAERVLRMGDAATATRWFTGIPLEWLEDRPRLAVTGALALFLAVHWDELERWSPRLREPLAGALEDEVRGRALTLSACAATMRADRPGTVDHARQALELLAPEDRFLRAVAAINLGASLFVLGQYGEARKALEDAARWSRKAGDLLGLEATCSYYEGRIELVCGRPREALEHHRRGWRQASSSGAPLPMASLSLAGQAEVHQEWGELRRAEELARRAIAVNRGCLPFNELRARLVLASVARSRRDFPAAFDETQAILDLMRHAALKQWESQVPIHRLKNQALRASRFGDREAEREWQQWATDFGLGPGDELEDRLLPEEPQADGIVLAIRWLLFQGERASALDWIPRLRSLAESRRWYRLRVETGLLEAMALAAQDPAAASGPLGRAFELAEKAGFIQVLADEREWLRDLPEAVLAPLFGARSDTFRTRLTQALAGPAPAAPHTDSASALRESLSAREIEVLQAVAAGGTNAAVGRALFISPRTVKKHLENIYGKLAVHGRVEAIQRARSLGLLEAGSPAALPASGSFSPRS